MELGTTHFMRQNYCVIKLWKYCIDVANKVMRVTRHANNVSNYWFVDHNALSQLICAEKIVWIKTQVGPGGKSYYNNWLLP